MRLTGLFVTLTCLLIVACEDNKKEVSPKANEDRPGLVSKSKTDTLKKKKESPPARLSDTATYPRISNKNVVEFLTAYGAANTETGVRIKTSLGDIDIQLYNDTPLHRANFIYLVKQGYFNSTFFHRVVPNFIIQGGNSDNIKTAKHRAKLGKYLLPAEIVSGRVHTYGTVSGAKEYRKNPDKRTAPYEFFIFLGPKSATGHLNGNYTIFGRVTSGMDVVEKVANLEADEGDWPIQNVYISAELID
jgi:peptidylprolyl isomerase